MFWRRVLVGALIAFNLFLLYSLMLGSEGYFAYKEQADNIEVLKAKIARLDQENLNLSRQVRLLRSDREYLERMVREQMKFVKNNETLYVFPEDHKLDEQADSPTSSPMLKNDPPEDARPDESTGASQDEGKN